MNACGYMVGIMGAGKCSIRKSIKLGVNDSFHWDLDYINIFPYAFLANWQAAIAIDYYFVNFICEGTKVKSKINTNGNF